MQKLYVTEHFPCVLEQQIKQGQTSQAFALGAKKETMSYAEKKNCFAKCSYFIEEES